jgi:hypothetical protein
LLFSGQDPARRSVTGKQLKKGNRSGLQEIEGALQTLDIAGQDMGVNLGALQIDMAKKILQHPDVHPLFQQVSGEAVAQGMAADLFVDASQLRRPPSTGHGDALFCLAWGPWTVPRAGP